MFEKPDLCALKGSSVEFRCSYNYSESEMVSDVAWSKGEKKSGRWIRVKLADLPSVHNRSVYLGDMQHKCGLAIHDLQENDTGHYYFHFDTDAYGRRSKTSVYLAVTEVRASVHPSSTVRAGWSVRLDCQTSCQNHTIWFKDGEPVTNTEFQAQIGDAGNYTCAIKGDESVQSDPVTLDVQYPTQNLSVELSYSGRLTLGISVNLTCCGAANPAAENYTWYRSTGANGSSMVQVGTGQVLSIPSVEATDFGRYLCKAQNLFWEISSPEILMEEEAESSEASFYLLIGLGVKVVIMLLLTVAIIWIWKRAPQMVKKSSLHI
ncbi:hemicentin-1-like isoform X2 [Takifugu rubripes]|nr:hemicentin-1-like isoform X2 [Takifugu rubripes]